MNTNRRQTLQLMSSALGSLAFVAMAQEQAFADADNPLAAKQPHFVPRAKNIIFLSMSGAPSHVDTFDYKPQLQKDSGKPGKSRGSGPLMGSPWEFNQQGESGLWISSLFPNLSKHADQLCLLRGMHCDQPNHSQAVLQTHTGNFQFVRPSLGAWTLYGLGTENKDLPGFIVLNKGNAVQNFGSAFLPAFYQGTPLGTEKRRGRPNVSADGAPATEGPQLPNIKNPLQRSYSQRMQLDLVQELNRKKLEREKVQPQVEGMIQSFELAFRMQTTMPALVDIAQELSLIHISEPTRPY